MIPKAEMLSLVRQTMRVVVRVAIGQAAAMFRQIGRELHGTGKVTNMGDGDGGYCG